MTSFRRFLSIAAAPLLAVTTLLFPARASAATNYAVCVGINTYTLSGCPDLNGCIPDATHVKDLVTSRGNWDASNVTMLTNSAAKLVKIRQTVSNYAARAVSGDKFLYYQSSHGGNNNYYFTTNSGKVYLHYGLDTNGVGNCICAYDDEYTAKKMATDLAAFPSGVEIVVMLDTCHSAGMFKYAATTSAKKALAAKLAEAKAGISADGSSDNGETAEEPAPANSVAGFFMAAVLDQLEKVEAEQVRRGLRPRSAKSLASNVGWIAAADYDQYSWDSQVSDGGEFTIAFIDGVTNQNMMCDNAMYGNQDGYASFYEGWNYAKDIARGQRNYSAWNYDSDYGYYDYIWTDAQCTNTAVLSSVLVGWAGDTAPVIGPGTPEIPSTPPVADTSSFTATWSAVADAVSYKLYVQQKVAASTSARAARDAATVLEADFSSTTGWTLSGTGTYGNSPYYGAGSPSIKFDGTGDYAIGPEFGGGSKLSFWAYGNGSGTASTFAISGLVNGSWTAIETVNIAQGAGTYEVNLPSGTTQLRFDFTKNGYNCALDDVVVTGSADTWEDIPGSPFAVTGTSKALTGLSSGTEYRYAVSAVDSDGVEGTRSSYVAVTTAEGDSAPSLSVEQTSYAVTVGDPGVDFTVTVTGSPSPTLNVSCANAVEDEDYVFYRNTGEFLFTPSTIGTYLFVFTATNGISPDASVTVTVTVSAAPVTIPTLTVSDVTSSSAIASWTACDGVTTYTLQLTDDAFPAASSAARSLTPILSEDFSGFTGTGTSDISGSLNNYTKASGWNGYKVYCHSGEAKVGASSGQPWITTPQLTVSGSLTVVWSARSYGSNDKTTLLLGISEDGDAFTDSTIDITTDMVTRTNTFNVSGTTAYIRWMGNGSSNARFYLDDVSITTPESGGGDDPGGDSVQEFTVSGTSHTFTNLTPDTAYAIRVKGNAGWSDEVVFETDPAGDSAPAWTAFPAETYRFGSNNGEYVFDNVGSYVSGSPAPVLALNDPSPLVAELEDGRFTFVPDNLGTFSFVFTAANSLGVVSNTLTVTVDAIAPELATIGDRSGTLGSDVTFEVSAIGDPAPGFDVTSSGADAVVVDQDGTNFFLFTPDAIGTYQFTVTATNIAGSDSETFTVTISAPPITVPVLTVTNITDTTALATWTPCEGVSSYTLQLTDDEFPAATSSAARSLTTLLNETFDKATGTATITSFDTKMDNPGWEGSYVLAHNGAVRLSSGSGSGELVSPWLTNATAGASVEVVFSSSTWTNDNTTAVIDITEDGENFTDANSFVLGASMQACTNTFTVSGTRFRIRWTPSVNKKRFFLDDITITTSESGGGDDPGGDSVQEFTVSGTSYTFTGLTPETYYLARVKGNAAWSEEVLFETEAAAGSAPVVTVPQASYSVLVGASDISFAVTATGTPAPTLTATCTEGAYFIFEDNQFLFEPDTIGTYHFVFTATNSEGSDSETVTVTVAGAAASISVPQTSYAVTVGDDVDFTVNATGAPEPAVTATCTEGAYFIFENNQFLFEPDTAGTYHFVFTATNSEGSDSVTVTVEVSAAPVTIPTLTITDVTDTTATASWDACTGVSSYRLQLATDDQFTSGGFEELLSESFDNVKGNSSSAIASLDGVTQTTGWSCANAYSNTGVLRLGKSGTAGSLQTPSFEASGTLRVVWDGCHWTNDSPVVVHVGVSQDGGEFSTTNVTLTGSMDSYTNTFEITGTSSVVVKWSTENSAPRFFIDNIVISGGSPAGSGGGSLVFDGQITGLSHTFTGLSPYTVYYARVQGDSYWSPVVDFLTDEAAGSAPVWSAIPAQTVAVGADCDLDLADYVSGTDPITITMAATEYDAVLVGTEFSFTPDTVGSFTFTFTAANDFGSSDATLTVTAIGNVPVVTVTPATYAYDVTVGDPYVEFTVTASGAPAPTLTASCTEGAYFIFENNAFLFDPDTAGTYHFVFTATNSEGSDSKTVTVTVIGGDTPLTDYQQWLQDHGIATDTSADAAAPNGHTYGENYAADIDPSSSEFLDLVVTDVSSGKFTILRSSPDRYYQLLYTTDLTVPLESYMTTNLGKGATSGNFPTVDGDWYGGLRATPTAP